MEKNPLKFKVGDQVEKVGGDYSFEGEIVATFHKLSGKDRYVCEDDRGVLHVFGPSNLKLIEPKELERVIEANIKELIAEEAKKITEAFKQQGGVFSGGYVETPPPLFPYNTCHSEFVVPNTGYEEPAGEPWVPGQDGTPADPAESETVVLGDLDAGALIDALLEKTGYSLFYSKEAGGYSIQR